MRNRTLTNAVLASAALLALTGCASEPEQTAGELASEHAATTSSSPTPTNLVTPVEEAVADFAEVTEVEQTGDSGVTISTSITDPRGDDGSAEAIRVVEICDVVSAVDGVDSVVVNESDGTGFALYRLDAGNLGPSGECFEY